MKSLDFRSWTSWSYLRYLSALELSFLPFCFLLVSHKLEFTLYLRGHSPFASSLSCPLEEVGAEAEVEVVTTAEVEAQVEEVAGEEAKREITVRTLQTLPTL